MNEEIKEVENNVEEPKTAEKRPKGRPVGKKDSYQRKFKRDVLPPHIKEVSAPTILDEDRQYMTNADKSIEMTTTATDEEVSAIVHFNYRWFKAAPVRSDDECEERMEAFFAEVEKTGEVPTIEKLALALGVTRRKLNEWELGSLTARRQWLVERAKETMAAVDAELAINNKLPQVLYIFRSKNYYGMKDEQNINLTTNNLMGDMVDKDEIASRYAEDIIEIDPDDVIIV